MTNAPTVSLKFCSFNKTNKTLSLVADYIGMPSTFFVESNITGNIVKFSSVQPGDVLFCEDSWDGEQCVYRPTTPQKNVISMTIYRQN